MIITGKNYIEDATLTSSSGLAGQNIENLKVPQLSKKYIMNGPGFITVTGISSFDSIVIDKGTCSGIYANVHDSTGQHSTYMNSTNTCFYLFSSYTGVTQIDFTINGLVDTPEIGYIHIGNYLQLPPINPTAGLYYSTTTQKTNSISGQQYTDKGYQFISTSFEFPRIPDSEEVFLGKTVAGRQEILATWRETEFQYAWLFPWESSLDKIPPIFGSMESDSLQFDRSEVDGLYWGMSFTFVEIK